MFRTLNTLFTGANARAEEHVRDVFALELIDQKIREADAQLKTAKTTLASLIQRQRAEDQQRQGLQKRIDDLTTRATDAIAADHPHLAKEAATAIAQMENELKIRDQTLSRLDQKILRLQTSIETGQRRIIDLKQGAIQARAVRREQSIQSKIAGGHASSSVAEAEELIATVLHRDDPFEHAQIMSEIDADLTHDTLSDRMADAGFGPATRSTADDVLKRLTAAKA